VACFSYAFIHYSDEEVCRKAHDSSQELLYQNRTLVVMYGKKAGAVVNNPVQKRQAPAAKRTFCVQLLFSVISLVIICH